MYVCMYPAAELTICMDISSNPGPANITETSLDMNCTNNTSAILQTHKSVCNQSCSFRHVYSRRELWDLKTNLEWIDIPDISGICLDTGIGDIDNLKIPIHRHFGILLPNTELKRYFKSNLLTITFRKQS